MGKRASKQIRTRRSGQATHFSPLIVNIHFFEGIIKKCNTVNAPVVDILPGLSEISQFGMSVCFKMWETVNQNVKCYLL